MILIIDINEGEDLVKNEESIKVIPLGGLGEIGKNITAI